MGELFTTLTNAVKGSPLIALSASVVWGILSIVLSPCHLSSIPLVIGFLNQQGKVSSKRAFVISFIFSLGILITIALVGIITAAIGRMLGDIGPYGSYLVAGIFFIVGLYLLEVISLPWSMPNLVNKAFRGLGGALALGLLFGIAVGPCTFAYMAPMLGVTFKVAAHNLSYGLLLLLAYGIGHCSVIVFAGTATNMIQSYLNWNEQSQGAVYVKKICGVLILLGGLYLLYIA